tara:strand:+ start:62 stop:1675 length:1614 start_codon:yes stop_codon:yes gene_type:complete
MITQDAQKEKENNQIISKVIQIKTKVEVISEENYTYRKLWNDFRSGKIVSVPELLQRILPKDVWTALVANAYMRTNFIFIGGSKLQTFVFITKQALLDSFNKDIDMALNNDNAEFIQEAIDIINTYSDAEEFIIDGQSRGLLALVPFFENEIKYQDTITFNNKNSYTDFFFKELSNEERDAILNQEIDKKIVIEGSLKDAASLVVGMNTNNPFSPSAKNWLIWFDKLKFDISRDIIYHFNLPALCSSKHIAADLAKYKFSTSGHIQLLFETIHLIKNINTPANYKIPSASQFHKILQDPALYMNKLSVDSEEYEMLRVSLGALADIQLIKSKIPKYANAINLLIKYQFLFNRKFETAQDLLKEVFPSFEHYTSRIKVNDRKEFTKVMLENEINEMSINEHELDSEGNPKKDADGKKIDDREGIKYIMQSTDEISKMKNRFKLIEGFLKKTLITLKDRGIIEIVHKRTNENWFDVFRKTSGTQVDMYGRPISDIHYLENMDKYDIGHKESNRSGGEETIENKELEDSQKNKAKGDRSY